MTHLPSERLTQKWFADDAVALAPRLLGKIVRYRDCAGIIVETEAYTTDPASHAFRITPRSEIMRDTYGYWYVYFTYGMHYCANITTNKDGIGAVLIRAVEPLEGIEKMEERRQKQKVGKDSLVDARGKAARPIPLTQLCAGPARFCQAFSITKAENGLPVEGEFAVYDAPEIRADEVGASPRIGIREGTDLPWRFYIKGNAFVSRKA